MAAALAIKKYNFRNAPISEGRVRRGSAAHWPIQWPTQWPEKRPDTGQYAASTVGTTMASGQYNDSYNGRYSGWPIQVDNT